MFNYLVDGSGVLQGPVDFPSTPGIGVQLPGNAVQLSFQLPPLEEGRIWVLVGQMPREMMDRRGVVYQKADGAKQIWSELGELPDSLTIEPWPGMGYLWIDNSWKLDEPTRLAALRSAVLNKRDVLLRDAVLRVAPLQYAEDIGDACHEEQLQLLEWKLYSVELNRIEKQAGFPADVAWPVTPGTPQ